MNILGVGPGELAVVFIIMLVVAGPKRMVQWAYAAGHYIAQLRAMFQETLNAVNKEFTEAGLDLSKDLPKIPTGRIDFLGEASKILSTPLPNPSTESAEQPAQTETPNPSTPSAASSSSDIDHDTDHNAEEPRYDSWLPN